MGIIIFLLYTLGYGGSDVVISVSFEASCLDNKNENKFTFTVANNSKRDITVSKAFLFWKVSIKDINGNELRPKRFIHSSKKLGDIVTVKGESQLIVDTYSDFISQFDLSNEENYTIEFTYNSPRNATNIGEIRANILKLKPCP